MVIYAAPESIAEIIVVSEAQSHSCEWLRPGSEHGPPPPSPTVALVSLKPSKLTAPVEYHVQGAVNSAREEQKKK